MKPNQLPSVEYLRRAFEYCPVTGELRWRFRDDVPSYVNSRFAGKVVGTPTSSGLFVRLNGTNYAIHRIIYCIMTGVLLEINEEIDHIDLCKFNNEWSNLRKVSHQQNMFNRSVQCNSLSQIKCVDELPNGRFRVRVSGMHIGCYSTREEAAQVARDTIDKFHGEFGRAS